MKQQLWFKVAADLPRHGKSLALAHRLEDKRAWTYVVAMWAWFCEQAGDGICVGPNASAEIAGGAGYEGDPEHFCRQMAAVGFLDRIAEGFRVHGWEEWAGYHIEAKKKNTAQKKERRGTSDRHPTDIPETSDGHPEDVPGTSGGPFSYLLSSSSVASEGGAGGNEPVDPIAEFRVALGQRTTRPPDWFRLSSAENMPDTRDRLTAEIARLGVERAADVVAERMRSEGKVKQWLRYYLGSLGETDTAPARSVSAAPDPDPDPGCPEWGTAREKVRGQIRPDLWRWFRPLRGRVAGGELVLVAPDAFHANFTRDTYGSFLTEQAGMPVRIEAAQ